MRLGAIAGDARIAGVVETSASFFTAMNYLRSDRTTTVRELGLDKVNTQLHPQLRQYRDLDLPALKAGLASMATVDFPGRETAVANLDKAVKRLEALHQETAAAMAQPSDSTGDHANQLHQTDRGAISLE